MQTDTEDLRNSIRVVRVPDRIILLIHLRVDTRIQGVVVVVRADNALILLFVDDFVVILCVSWVQKLK